MENPLPATSSALNLLDNCGDECEISVDSRVIVECVLKLFNKSIEKLKIVTIIPMLLDDEKLLKQCLTKSQFLMCLKYFNEYAEHHEVKGTDDIALIELIDLLCENPNVRDLLPKYYSKDNTQHTEFITTLEEFKEIMEVRLNTSAFSELRKEKAMHRIYHDNLDVLNLVAHKRKEFHLKEIQLCWKLSVKQSLTKKYIAQLAEKKWDNNIKIKTEILKSCSFIKDFQIKSKQKQNRLAAEIKNSQEAYERSLKADLKLEKEVRDEKNKLLLQLQGLIKKYDQNIGEKIKEYSEIQKIYDERERKLNEFLVGYYIKESEYNDVANRKIAIETAEFEQKVFFFAGTRAAKIIQRWWRKYLKLLKKRAKAEKMDLEDTKKKKNK